METTPLVDHTNYWYTGILLELLLYIILYQQIILEPKNIIMPVCACALSTCALRNAMFAIRIPALTRNHIATLVCRLLQKLDVLCYPTYTVKLTAVGAG